MYVCMYVYYVHLFNACSINARQVPSPKESSILQLLYKMCGMDDK